MKTLRFSQNRDRVTSLLLEFIDENIHILDLNNQSAEVIKDSFEIDVVTDQDEKVLYDYQVFDPSKSWYKGFLYPSGWSNWQMDAYKHFNAANKKEWDRDITDVRPQKFEIGMNVKSYCIEDGTWLHGQVDDIQGETIFVKWENVVEPAACEASSLKNIFLDNL